MPRASIVGGEGGLALHEFDRVHFFLGLADGLPGLRSGVTTTFGRVITLVS
jgi:hypothetical protein